MECCQRWPARRDCGQNPTTPSILYAAIEREGIFKTTDGGSSWRAVNTGTGLPDANMVFALAINPGIPSTLYAGTYAGIFKSVDSGDTWSAANSGLPNGICFALAIDPSTSSTVYAARDDAPVDYVVYKSTDGGSSWRAVNNGLPPNMVEALAIDPTTPSTLYAQTLGGVFKSSNAGGTWTAASSGVVYFIHALAINPTTPRILYAGTKGGGIYRSTDGASSWTTVNTGLPVTSNSIVDAIAINPTTPRILYAATDGGLFKSTDSGSSWTAVNTGLPPLTSHFQSTPNSPNRPAQARRTAGILEVKIDAERVFIDGTPMTLPVRRPVLFELLGKPSRSGKNGDTTVYVWDEFGIRALEDQNADDVDVLTIVVGDMTRALGEPKYNYPKMTFSGRLEMDGAAVTSQSTIETVNRAKRGRPLKQYPPLQLEWEIRYGKVSVFVHRANLANEGPIGEITLNGSPSED